MKKITLFQMNKKYFCLLRVFLVLFVSCLGVACSTVQGTAKYAADKTGDFVGSPNGRADFDLDQGIRFYKEARIYLSEISTRVHPTANLDKRPTALFVPLGLVQDSRDHYDVSQGVSRIIYESFLAEGTFAALEYAAVGVPYHVEHLLPFAKEKGAEYLVGGIINQYYDGGHTGDSRFAMQLYVYRVSTGDLMWSVHHGGILPYKSDGDFALFKVKNRMPVNPMSTLVSAVGDELALLLHYWTEPKLMKKREMENELKDSYRGYIAPDAF